MRIARLIMKVCAILLLVFTLVTSRLLPLQILLAIGAIEILLLLLVWKRKVIQVFVVILMLITSTGLLYVEFVAQRIINYDPNVVNTISFFVPKDSKITSLKSAIKNKADIAYSTLLDDQVVTFMQTQLTANKYTEPMVSFEGIADGIAKLYNGTYDILAVDQGYLSSLQQYDSAFLENTKVIWSITKTDALVNLPQANVTKKPFVIYIAGLDNRDTFQANRHDANIIAVVDPVKHVITIVSVPRDSYVQLGCKKGVAMDKLTHAGVYSMDCAIKTMQNLLGVDVNFYAAVYFDTVTKLVDALGGIDVYVEEAFNVGDYKFTKGMNKLNSVGALYLARARSAFVNGDQTRIKNQQEVIKGIINKLLEPSSLTKIESIVRSVQGTIKTNMAGDDIFALVRMQITGMKGWTFNQIAVTGSDAFRPSYAMGGRNLYVVLLDDAKLKAAKAALQAALQTSK
jgi:LCP family protein required for cell wall assembly